MSKVLFRLDVINQHVHTRVHVISKFIKKDPTIQNTRGAKCSINGKKYEERVANVCNSLKSVYQDVPLNTQSISELGGCTSGQDLYLNYKSINDIGVEVKRITPDWMQMSIRPDNNGNWSSSGRTKIPHDSKTIFESYISSTEFPVPPFLDRDITYEEWERIEDTYKDKYIDIPSDTISRAYSAKNTHYIQLLNYGLYHTGNDPCNFGVPYFECHQRLRIRCKRHGKKDSTGKHIPSSVMASLCPKLSTLKKSNYTLDDNKVLLNGLMYR